jgi:hypothetical protein
MSGFDDARNRGAQHFNRLSLSHSHGKGKQHKLTWLVAIDQVPQACTHKQSMSAFWGKAEMRQRHGNVAF